MSDKQLADRIVELGVGYKLSNNLGFSMTPDVVWGLSANGFVREWRVAGVLMEKVIAKENRDINCGQQDGNIWAAIEDYGDLYFSGQSESLPRAICEACCKALEQ